MCSQPSNEKTSAQRSCTRLEGVRQQHDVDNGHLCLFARFACEIVKGRRGRVAALSREGWIGTSVALRVVGLLQEEACARVVVLVGRRRGCTVKFRNLPR
jgi:hypothetical protein